MDQLIFHVIKLLFIKARIEKLYVAAILFEKPYDFWTPVTFDNQVINEALTKVLGLTEIHEIRTSRVTSNSRLNYQRIDAGIPGHFTSLAIAKFNTLPRQAQIRVASPPLTWPQTYVPNVNPVLVLGCYDVRRRLP